MRRSYQTILLEVLIAGLLSFLAAGRAWAATTCTELEITIEREILKSCDQDCLLEEYLSQPKAGEVTVDCLDLATPCPTITFSTLDAFDESPCSGEGYSAESVCDVFQQCQATHPFHEPIVHLMPQVFEEGFQISTTMGAECGTDPERIIPVLCRVREKYVDPPPGEPVRVGLSLGITELGDASGEVVSFSFDQALSHGFSLGTILSKGNVESNTSETDFTTLDLSLSWKPWQRDRFAAYLRGGPGWTRFDVAPLGNPAVSRRDDAFSLHLAAGFDTTLHDRLILRTEALGRWFESSAPWGDQVQLTLGLGWKF